MSAVSLRAIDLRALLAALDRLHRPVAPADFPGHLFGVLAELLPGVIASFDFADLAAGGRVESHVAPEITQLNSRSLADYESAVAALVWQHPAMEHWKKVDPRVVARPTDFVSQREFRATEFYQECHRPVRVHHQIVSGLAWAGHVGGFTVNRPGARGFTDREIELIRQLRPHVERVFADSLLLADLRARLESARGATPGEPGAADFDAARLLAQGLSRREVETLRWLAEGKRDAEIARILGVSAHTVHSHVARILDKLGVETRTAAAATAYRWLAAGPGRGGGKIH